MALAVAQRRRNRLWAMFAMPGVGWLIAFFVMSVYAVMAVAFGEVDPILKRPLPIWNPLQWDTGAFSTVLHRVFGGDLQNVFVRTFLFVALALAGCIAIGYPVAYFVARKSVRHKGIIMAALVLPYLSIVFGSSSVMLNASRAFPPSTIENASC